MRTLSIAAVALVALWVTPDAAAQATPSLRATHVVPGLPGEAIRVTTYARRPPQRGRLARRYRGIRVNRTAGRAMPPAITGQPVARTYHTTQASFVRRGGSYFQVLPR